MRGLLPVTALLTAGCAFLPDRVRETPELRGQITSGGAPVAAAAVSVVRLVDATPSSGEAADAVCRGHDAGRVTDGEGTFSLRADWMWVRARGRRDPVAEARGGFGLCVSAAGGSPPRLVFRAPAGRWDTLELACDLQRAWLAADRDGMQGRCAVRRAAVDGQQLAARRGAPPALTCDTTTTLIEPLRLGPVRVNGSVAELRRLCPMLRDSTVSEEGLYGPQVERVHVLNMAGAPVVIFKSSGVIHRIVVAAPVFRTRDSLGVGSRVTRLLDKPDLHVVVSGHYQGPYVFAWHGKECGLGYSLTRPTYDMRDRIGKAIPTARLRAWPASTSIRRVVIGFCPQREFPDV